MFCPQCGAEYRPGYTECTDCRLLLVSEKPASRKPWLDQNEPVYEEPEFEEPDASPPDPDMPVVTVLEMNDPLALAGAKGALRDAGIPFYVIGEDLGTRFGPTTPLLNPWCRIEVGADREEEARAAVEQFRDPKDDSDS